MFRGKVREKLQVGKPYTFAEIFNIMGADIGPEVALQKYNKLAAGANVKTRLPRDSAIVSGKRAIIRNQLNQMVMRGGVRRNGDSYTLQPAAKGSETGIEQCHFEQWLKESEWVSLADLIEKARPGCNEELMIRDGQRNVTVDKSVSREEWIRRGIRRRIMKLAGLLVAKGLLEEKEVISYRRLAFARPKSSS